MVGFFRVQRSGFFSNLLGLPSSLAEERNIRAQAHAILRFFELDRYADDVANSLPYGLQRRLEIAAPWRPCPTCCCWTNPPPA